MNSFVQSLLSFFMGLGPFGPALFGVLDSSFLVLPFGNDLLVVLLVAQHREWFAIYAVAAALGSLGGVFIIDLISRKGGEEGLRKLIKPRRFDRLKARIGKGAGRAVLFACIAPPPFPFTPAVAAASAFQYPRNRLFWLVLAGRLTRFFLIALLALWIGRRVLAIMNATWFVWSVVALIAICVVASTFAIISRLRQ